jgi:hypothetical protein
VIEANKVILDIEMNLRVKLCAGWGLSPSDPGLRSRAPKPANITPKGSAASTQKRSLHPNESENPYARQTDGSRVSDV